MINIHGLGDRRVELDPYRSAIIWTNNYFPPECALYEHAINRSKELGIGVGSYMTAHKEVFRAWHINYVEPIRRGLYKVYYRVWANGVADMIIRDEFKGSQVVLTTVTEQCAKSKAMRLKTIAYRKTHKEFEALKGGE